MLHAKSDIHPSHSEFFSLVDLIRVSSMVIAAKLLNNRRARPAPSVVEGCHNKTERHRQKQMNNTAKKQVEKEEPVNMTVVKNPEPEVAPQPAAVLNPIVVPPAPAPEPELTLEQKISKVEDLTMVIDRWRKLIESRRNLQTFKLSTDGMSNHLRLVDTTSGHEFKTYNTAVISSVLEVIRKTLDEKITEVETLIRF